MKYCTLLLTLLLFISTQRVMSQDRLPVREYSNPDELIALSADVSFSDALYIIEELAMDYKDKIFVNQTDFQGPIGVNIPQMHWEDALYEIAANNGLVVNQYERYYEILNVPLEEQQQADQIAEEAGEDVVNVNFGSREIEISATFFQGDRSLLREIGVDWTTLRDNRVQVDNFSAGSVSRDVFQAQFNFTDILDSGWDINALFSAFEDAGKGEILSSPTVKVLDGETGNIQVGQDFSIKQRDFAGNITDRFFNTGTILNVQPRVFYKDDMPFIYMRVEAERSTAQPDPVSTIVNKQEATTDLLLLSGESAVIAGLYETEVSSTRRGVPILKDLPGWFLGLRYLFGYEQEESTVQELVVLIKATLVPTLEERMNAPFNTVPELLREQRNRFQLEVNEMQENNEVMEGQEKN